MRGEASLLSPSKEMKLMKWSEIKEAVEQTGINEDDEILEIRCEPEGGSKLLQPVRLGGFLRLVEPLPEDAQKRESAGCAI
jgi:hypothetical protein